MTKISHTRKNSYAIVRSFVIFAVFMSVSFFLSESISKDVLTGLKFSVTVLLPSVFPFMVFSDFAANSFEFEKSKFLSRLFERVFKINSCAISAFFSGITGGFPVGAKNAISLYQNGKISKDECERLMSFSNIASPAYTVSAVGIGMMSDFKIGLILYAVLIFSATATGFFIGINKSYIAFSDYNIRQNYSFVNSLKSSSVASTNLVFFISFFWGICGIIKSLPISDLIKTLLISFSEVGSAVSYISDLDILSQKTKLALIAFSLSFSGLCVIVQSLALVPKKEISSKNCIKYKLLQGIVSFTIVLLLPI